MTTKEYLQEVYYIDRHIKRLQRRREDLRRDLYSIGSPSGKMDADKVQTSMSGDTMLRLIAKVDDLERDIVLELERLTDKKQRVTEEIEALEDERYRMLLFDRYILFYSWEQVAVDMHYRIKWVYELHGKALQAFAEKWGS
jgi:hypothetical protein